MSRKTHRPCCWLAFALAFGILVGHFLPFPLLWWMVLCALGILVFMIRPWTWAVYVALFCLGAALIHVAHVPWPDVLAHWRLTLKGCLYHYLDPDEAAAMSAIVLGDRTRVPKEIYTVFKHTGTGHVLVIAGLHMAMIAAIIFFILRLMAIPRRVQIFGTILLLFVYGFLVGAPLPVMRAIVMASIFLASYAFEAEPDGLNSLGLAALILLLTDAENLFSAGFQLSFAAVAGILLMARPMERKLAKLPRWLALSLAVSASVWVATTPLQIWHFGSLVPIALLANIAIVPLLEISVALGLLLVLAAVTLPVMAWPLAGCLKLTFNLMVLVAYWFSQMPFGYIQLYVPKY